MDSGWRLAVDIGGTFTDLVLASESLSHSTKVLTTPDNPEVGVLEPRGQTGGVARVALENDEFAIEVQAGVPVEGSLVEAEPSGPPSHRRRCDRQGTRHLCG